MPSAWSRFSLRNRWRRQQLAPELRDEVMPKNIIMIGPTGVGKQKSLGGWRSLPKRRLSRWRPQSSPKSATWAGMSNPSFGISPSKAISLVKTKHLEDVRRRLHGSGKNGCSICCYLVRHPARPRQDSTMPGRESRPQSRLSLRMPRAPSCDCNCATANWISGQSKLR